MLDGGEEGDGGIAGDVDVLGRGGVDGTRRGRGG